MRRGAIIQGWACYASPPVRTSSKEQTKGEVARKTISVTQVRPAQNRMRNTNSDTSETRELKKQGACRNLTCRTLSPRIVVAAQGVFRVVTQALVRPSAARGSALSREHRRGTLQPFGPSAIVAAEEPDKTGASVCRALCTVLPMPAFMHKLTCHGPHARDKTPKPKPRAWAHFSRQLRLPKPTSQIIAQKKCNPHRSMLIINIGHHKTNHSRPRM